MNWRRCHPLTSPPLFRLVFVSWVVLIPKLFDPLQKLKIVLHLALDQLLDRDRLLWTRVSAKVSFGRPFRLDGTDHPLETHLVNLVALESFLQDLEVRDVFVLMSRSKIQLRDLDIYWEQNAEQIFSSVLFLRAHLIPSDSSLLLTVD